MKAKNIKNRIRTIDCTQKQPFKIIQNDLKDSATDFVIHELTAGTHSFSRKRPNIKYQPIKSKININGTQEQYNFQAQIVFQKYYSKIKESEFEEMGIEETVDGIIKFIEHLKNSFIFITLGGQKNPQNVILALVEKYFQQKRRQILKNQCNQVKKALATKYKKVIFNQQQTQNEPNERTNEGNSQRVSRSTITALMEKDSGGKKYLQVPTKSKLKILVDSCNIFQHPQRVQSLKRQKLIAQFCGQKQGDFNQVKQQIRKNYPNNNNGSLAADTFQFLSQWINEISVTQALFKRKYQPQSSTKQNKHKIAVSSSSEDD